MHRLSRAGVAGESASCAIRCGNPATGLRRIAEAERDGVRDGARMHPQARHKESPTMKWLISLLAAATIAALGAGTALAHSATTPKPVQIVMHDPGCHWFSAGGKLTTSLTVKAPIRLANLDEASLRIHVVGISSRGDRLDPVGGWVRLDRGAYTITMVGQAPDDNHLQLVVK
jgi:hypothetical protein